MIIVDASVVYKWIIHEQDEAVGAALLLRDRYIAGDARVSAPDLLLYEIANILAYKASLSRLDAQEAWKNFLLLDLPVVTATRIFVGECLTFSRQYHISVYDAAYVILAKIKQCDLVTADKKLVARVKLPYVRSILSYS
ncbi:MAG: type II toxin-antitoxin system VapC family toxin [Patescibacteria group bacterium]